MNASIKALRKAHTAAATICRAVYYATINGRNYADLIAGRTVLASTVLTNLGHDDDFTRRYSSPFGRTIAKAWRAITGTEPTRVWVQRDARWIRVATYPVNHAAIDTAIATYPRTAHHAALPAAA